MQSLQPAVVVAVLAVACRGDNGGVGLENVVFDLGDVIVDLDHEAFKAAMTPIAGKLDDPAYRGIVERFETGKLTPAEFRQALRALKPENATLSDQAIDAAWSSQIGPIDCRKVELIQRVRREGFRTYVLSTTNPLHAPIIEQRFASCLPPGTKNVLCALFEKVYFTHEVGYLKPHAAVYEAMLKDSGMDPRRTLFLDDSPRNVLGAQRAGLYALLVTGPGFVDWLPRVLRERPGE